MPYDDPDPTDPMTLHGVGVETNDAVATVEMAQCFIEEYVRMGFSGDRIMRIFRTPGYAGPHVALRLMGEQRIAQLIADEMAFRGITHPPNKEAFGADRGGVVHLRVLDD